MNESDDSALAAQAWLSTLLGQPGRYPTTLPLREPAAPALAALAAEALAHGRSLLLVTRDDHALPDISNALDLNLRPLCLVLPAADHVCRIVLRATLSLLRSRLIRTAEDGEGPAWAAQRQRLADLAQLWQRCLAWSERGLDNEAWPVELVSLFPVRILPVSLARQLNVRCQWVVIVDPERTNGQADRTWPGAECCICLEHSGGHGMLVATDPLIRERAEFEVLIQELSELELELATAQAEVADFSDRYHRMIGIRMSTLDSLQAELAVRLAEAAPADMAAQDAAEVAWARAERSRQENQRYSELAANAPGRFSPSQDIKRLFRKLAQKIHPDRARNEEDRAWRTQLMAEANRAYRAGDQSALDEIHALWLEGACSQSGPAGDGFAARVARLKRRIMDIEGELNRLFGSRLYELFTAANIARRAGRDLLQEMAARLDADISNLRARLAT